MEQRIDYNFVEKLRLIYAPTNFVIVGDEIIIVSEEETHDYLLNNFTISDSILKYYYKQTSKYLSDDEFKKMVDIGFRGEKDFFLKPYPVIIYGAYFHRIDLITKLGLLTFEKTDCIITLNSKKVEYFDDLYPYFKIYSEGFIDGYDNFENACINKYLTMFPDKTDFVNKVFEFLTKKIIFQHDWSNNHRGFQFSVNMNNSFKKMEISGGFENGREQGRFYKAWKIVFSNNELFKPLFDKLQNDNEVKSNNLLETTTTKVFQQTETDKPEEVKKELPTHIFKGNAFEIWQSMFDMFNITKSSRTDIDFMFQIMKYDNLIYDTIGLIDIQNWINEYYEITFDKIKYTDPNANSNKKRMVVYNLINPK